MNTTVVSVGGNCQCRYQAQRHKTPFETGPFDNVGIASWDVPIALRNLGDLFQRDNLIVGNHMGPNVGCYEVWDRAYRIFIPHAIKTPDLSDYDVNLRQKMDYLNAKFLDILNSGDRVVFLHRPIIPYKETSWAFACWDMTRSPAMADYRAIADTIREMCVGPSLLVVVLPFDLDVSEAPPDGVVFYRQGKFDWRGDPDLWLRIFREIGVPVWLKKGS